jgi:uncharacterized membrane protein YidH (DUF202 family)
MTPPRGPMWSGADGASAERTRLAWRRTVLTTTGVALLGIRLATRAGTDLVAGIGIGVVVAAWLAQLFVANRRIQAMADREPPHARRSLPATALLTVVLAVLGIALTLASRAV